MAELKLKPEFAKLEFGFNNSFAPLGKRDDLHLLARDAKANNVTSILNMFENTDDAVIKKAHEEAFKKSQAEKNNAQK